MEVDLKNEIQYFLLLSFYENIYYIYYLFFKMVSSFCFDGLE